MKTWRALVGVVVIALLAAECWARGRGGRAGAGGPGEGGRAAWAERANPDTNGDGVVDDTEAKIAADQAIARAANVLNRIKGRHDTDGDGTLNEAETAALLNALEEKGRSVPKLVTRIDTDKDWNISEEEEVAFAEHMTSRLQNKGGVRAGLAREERVDPDTNGDCIVDEAEQAAAIKRAVERLTAGFRQRNARILEHFDVNTDGKLDEAEQAKAKEALEARRARMQERRLNRQGAKPGPWGPGPAE